MKLHLPGGLRAALMACFAVVTGIASTLSTATVTGGVFAVTVAAQTYAADADYQDVVLNAETGTYDLAAGTTYNLSTALEGKSIVLNAPSLWGAANQYHGINVDAGVSVSLSGINVRDINYPYTWLYPDHRPEHTEYTKLGGGTLTITGAPAMVGSYDDRYIHDARPSNITVNDGTLVIDFLAADGSSFVRNNVTITEGATLTLQHENATGTWDSGCANIILTGENGKAATLEVNNVMNFYRAITLEGNARVVKGADAVTGSKLVAVGGKSTLSAQEKNNIISSDVLLNGNLTVDVALGGTLDFTGIFESSSETQASLIKTGDGNFILTSGAASAINGTLAVQKGEVINKGYLTVNNLTVEAGSYISNGGTDSNLVINGEIWLGETIMNDGVLTFGANATLLNPYQLVQKIGSENGYANFMVIIAKGGSIVGADRLLSGDGVTYDGKGTFSLRTKELTFAGSDDDATPEPLVWGASSISFKGDNISHSSNDWVMFASGFTKATLDADAVIMGLEVAEDATLSIDANTKNKKLSASVLKLDGTLELLNTVDLQLGAWQYGEDCELHVNWADAASDSYLSGYSKSVVVKGGSLKLASGTVYDSLSVASGGNVEFTEDNDYSGDVSLSGTGNNYGNGAAVFAANASHSGIMTIAESGAGLYVWSPGREGTIKGQLVLEGTLTKQQTGTLAVMGDISGYGGMVVNSGVLRIGTWYTQQGSLQTGDITVNSGARLELHHDAGTFLERDGKADLFLKGNATLQSTDVGNETQGYQWGTLDISGENIINYTHKGKLVFDEVTTGNSTEKGKLSITVSSESGNSVRVTEFSAVNDFHGLITQKCDGSSQHKLVLGTVDQGEDKVLTVQGGVYATNFSKLGEGTLQVDSLTIDGRIMMNYEGTLSGCTFNAAGEVASVIDNITEVLTLNPGVVLAYGKLSYATMGDAATIRLTAKDFSAIESSSKKASFDVSLLSLEELAQGIDTGISGIALEDIDKYFTGLTIVKLDLRTAEGSNVETLHLSLSDAVSAVDWDPNWGLQDFAPVYVLPLAQAPSSMALYGSDYHLADSIEVVIVDSVDGASVCTTTSNVGDVVLPGGVWIKVKGGNLELVAGGRHDLGAIITADTHIELEEGATVAYVAGANAEEWYGTFTGDTYISVDTHKLTGAVAGGGFSVRGAYQTQVGNTNVYVYKPLNQNRASAWAEVAPFYSPACHAVVGGHINMQHHTAHFSLTGDTNVTIDLSDYTGEVKEFNKAVIGSSHLWLYGAGGQYSTVNHTGEAKVTIMGKDVTFKQAVLGVSYLAPGGQEGARNTVTEVLDGNSYVTIQGGSYSHYVMGGSYITNEILTSQSATGISDTTITGSTTLTLNGAFGVSVDGGSATGKAVVGGSVIDAAASFATIGKVGVLGETEEPQGYGTNVILQGGSYVDVVGGNLVNGTGSSSTIHHGSHVTVSGDSSISGTLVGGSWVSATAGEVAAGNVSPAVKQGTVLVSLQGGRLSGDVYAAGMQSTENDAIVMTTTSTCVEISKDVVFDGDRMVRGGYNEGAANATVVGSKTLSFTRSGDYANISHVLFCDFNEVSVAKDATIELVGTHGSGETTQTQNFEMLVGAADGVLTKTGEGTLTMGSNMEGASVSVQSGTLKMNASLTSITVGNGGTLDATTAGISLGALTVDDKAVLTLDGSTGLALAAHGTGNGILLTMSARAKMTINVADPSAERIVLFTGVSEDTISGITFSVADDGAKFAVLASYVSNYAELLGGNGVLVLEDDGSLVISKQDYLSYSWKWSDVTGGVWKDDTPEEGDWNQLASPAGAPVVFGNEGMGSATDSVTTITIEGNVTPESVQVNATRGSYVFTGTGSIVDMSATEPTSLTKSGASTLRIETANSYSGGTTLTGGVLEVANADALGKGVTRFNGGTLAYDLDEEHTVTGDELALFVGYTGTVNVALVGGPTDAAEDITWDFSDGASKAVLGADQHVSGEGMLTLHAIGSAGGGKSMTIADAATAAEGTTPASVGTTVKLTGSDLTFAYSLEGKGTLEVASTGITTISGDNSGFGGTILLEASSDSDCRSFASNAATGGTATTLALNGTRILHATTAGGRYEAGTVALTGTNVLDGYTTGSTRYIFAGDFVGGTTDSLLVRPGCTVEFEGSMADFSGTIGHDTQGNYADRTYVFRFVGKTPEGGEANTCKPSAGGDIFGAGAKLDVTGMNTTVTYEFAYSNKALNMNATVTGNANVTQSGTGTLVLTQANTATGTLTVNSGIVAIGTEGSEGSVGNWSGDADVNGTGELHLVNVTGGALAGAVTADADSTVKLQNSNGLTSISGGKLVVDGGSSAVSSTAETALEALQLVNGGSLSIGGDLAVKGSITSGGEGYEAGGDLSVGGKLTIGSVNADGMRSDSRMNIGGALSGVTKLNILGNLGPLPGTTDALITADSFAAVDKKLTVAFEREEQVSYINMSIGETYTLLSTTQTLAAFDSLTLQAGATTADTESAAVLVDGMKYSLVAGANSIVLKASFNGLEWTSTDGTWGAAEDWNGTLPTATSDLGLVGGGTAGVEVAVARQANSLRVDTAGAQGANAVKAYTLSGSGSLSMDSALLVSSGSLTIDALNVKSEGSTVIGSLTRPEQEATLSVGAAALSTLPPDLNADTAADEFATVGKLETGSLTLQSAAGSFTNNGLTSVTGALITELADGQCLDLTNNGMLRMGDKSNVGTITGSGVVWATGGTAIVAALDGAALAKASGGATLSVGRVNNALGFSLLDETSSISIREGDVTATSLNSNGGLLNIDGKLTLASKTSSGGRVKAGSVDMAAAAGSTLTSLQTGSLTLNLNTLAVGSPLLTLTDNVRNALGEAQTSSIKLTLTGAVAADGVAGMDLSTFTYDNQSNLGTRCNEQATLSDGSTYLREWTEYTLVDVTAANSLYSWDLSGTDLAELQQRFAEENGSYAQLTATDGGDIVLKVYKDDLREWNGGDVFDAIDKTVPAESASRWAGTITNAGGEVLDLSQLGDTYTALDSVELVNITEKETLIDLTELTNDATANPDGLLINHLSGADAESTLTLKGDAQDLATLRNDTLRYATADEDKDGIADDFAKLGSTSYAGTLVIEGMQVKAEGVLGEDGKPANSLEVGTTQFAVGSDSWLNVDSSADYRTGGLVSTAKDYGKISGTITVTGTAGKGSVSNGTLSGGYSGSYSNATVALADGADQRLVLGAGENELSLISDPSGVTSAKATLSYTEGNADMGTITVTNTHLTLDNMGSGVMNTLGVADGSTMTGGTLTFSLNAADIAAGLAGTAGTPVITDALSLKDTTVIVNLADGDKAVEVDLSGAGSRKTLFTLSENGTVEGLTAENIQLNGAFFNRYFDLSTLTVEKGAVIADVVTNYYTNRFSQSENGTAGLQMLDAADLELAPQGNVAQYKDLAGVMDALQGFKASEAAAADKLAAAVAGSGVASLGMALSGDVERQLKAIRNRTTTMGVDPSVVNEDMPYFNAWINAEGDYRSMDDGGTLAGYTVNSYGGTVGFDMDVTPELTWGLALTAMYGDFESTTVDKVDGDMDTYYVSAFARATHGAWTHTFVATVGMSQSELSRTVSHKYGSYTTEGEADGMSFGFLYEAARTYALNEDATACWQPVFNVSFRHISVDGYEEEGSDAALKVGDQSLNTVTFGLGGRLQSIVGENVYNRTSVFEARALVKFDVGDRESEVENALINAPSATATVKSAELDTIGLEVGAGLTVPVGFDAGSIFVDGSLEFRGSYTNFNAAAGYRVNF